MEKEFIKCEVNFKFKDGDVMHGERKIVYTSKIGDYVESQIALYKERYPGKLSKAIVVLFSWSFTPHRHCSILPRVPRQKG